MTNPTQPFTPPIQRKDCPEWTALIRRHKGDVKRKNPGGAPSTKPVVLAVRKMRAERNTA